eukprot:257100_1
MSYFCAISRYINHIKRNNKNINFKMEVFINCAGLKCVYDPNIKFVSTIKTIKYLTHSFDKNQIKLKIKTSSKNITQTLQSSCTYSADANVLLIIDRTDNDENCNGNDMLYLIQNPKNQKISNELRQNYLIGMEFVIQQNINKVYLNYGNKNRFRFYPEA